MKPYSDGYYFASLKKLREENPAVYYALKQYLADLASAGDHWCFKQAWDHSMERKGYTIELSSLHRSGETTVVFAERSGVDFIICRRD